MIKLVRPCGRFGEKKLRSRLGGASILRTNAFRPATLVSALQLATMVHDTQASIVSSSHAVTEKRPDRNSCWRSFSTVAIAGKPAGRIPFLLADIGEGIKEVEILQWFVHPGDRIQQFDKVCEVQSDKATVEITSRYDGVVLELAGDTGDMLQVGEPLLYVQGDDDDNESECSLALEAASALEDADTPPEDTLLSIPSIASNFHLDSDPPRKTFDKILTSPAVRKIAKEYGVDLATIRGTGPGGRVLKADLITYLKENGLWRDDAVLSTANSALNEVDMPSGVLQSSSTVENRGLVPSGEDEIVRLKGYNRLMIQAMTAALKIPHMCFGDEWNVDKLVACRQDLKDIGSNVSLLALLIKCCSLALSAHPTVNALVHSVEDGTLLVRRNHDLGVAMDTPRGLVVPVIRSVQDLSLQEIQDELDRLKALAQDCKLEGKDLERPSFTVSNIGSFGGTYMQPVIVPPQVSMGAIGQIQRLPRFDEDGKVYAARVVAVSWAGDHRFLDGATLAKFNATYRGYAENPVRMLTNLRT